MPAQDFQQKMLETMKTAAEMTGKLSGSKVGEVVGIAIANIITFVQFAEPSEANQTEWTKQANRSAIDSLLGLIDGMDKLFGGDGVTANRPDGDRLPEEETDPYLSSVDKVIDLLTSLGEAIGGLYDESGISAHVNDLFLSALRFMQRVDPLALDLDGDGIETVAANTGITFDFDGDGLKTGTGWVKGDDGLLVLDRNGNGTIDNGGELFGVDTVKSNGQKATSGFDALRDLDSNGDGAFDTQDAQFANVRVWQDANQDGLAQASELKTLVEHDITAINLESTASNQASNGNVISAVGSYVRGDGTEGAVNGNQSLAANLDLTSNPFYREYTDKIAISEDVATLPDMQGSGAVRDLREAAMLSTALKNKLSEYTHAQTREQQMDHLDGLIAAWSGSTSFQTFDQRLASMNTDRAKFVFSYSWEVPVNDDLYSSGGGGGSSAGTESTTGASVNSGPTAEQLRQKEILEKIKLLEVFNGRSFFNFDGSSEVTNTDGTSRIDISLRSGASTIHSSFGGSGGTITDEPTTYYITEKHLGVNFNQAALIDESYAKLRESVYSGLLLQTRLKPYVDAIGVALDGDGFKYEFSRLVTLVDESVNPVTSVVDLLEFRTTTVGNIVPAGEISSLLNSLHDRLTPQDIADITKLFGVKTTSGDDVLAGSDLQGGLGDDVLFALGTDNRLSGGSDNDQLFGGAGNDSLYGDNGNDILVGGGGNDMLDGGTGSNTLYGDAGNDILKVSNTSNGNVLAGGAGDDSLTGSYYSDTYLFNLGDGVDTIYESVNSSASTSYTDVLRFGAGINSSDMRTQRSGYDLVFAHINGTDKVILKNLFTDTTSAASHYGSSVLERVEFADGTVWTWAQMIADGIKQTGTDGADSLVGWAGRDTLEGGAGNDTLDGGTGSNTLYGDAG
ncbi:calcium-binding protein, partial [Stutzerimonas degradans]